MSFAVWKWAGLAVLGLYVAGFLLFVATLPRAPQDLRHIDAVVALTGGEMRIGAAYSLFEKGIGKRLLISGVHPNTTKTILKRRLKGGARFDCCVDLGYAAENTHENAREAASWARFYHFRSLLIVTARYHMPRALAEFREAMPGMRIEPYPIDPQSLPKGWWHDGRALKLLHGEYAKYLAASLLRLLGLVPTQAATG